MHATKKTQKKGKRERENPRASLFVSREVKRCNLSLPGRLITVPAVAVPPSPAQDRSHFQPRCCDWENIWLPLKLPRAKSKELQRSWTEKFFPPPSPLLILSFFLIQAGANGALQKRLCEICLTHSEPVGLEGGRGGELSVKATVFVIYSLSHILNKRSMSRSGKHKDLVFKKDGCVICFWPHHNVIRHK